MDRTPPSFPRKRESSRDAGRVATIRPFAASGLDRFRADDGEGLRAFPDDAWETACLN
jgi:hypothetical protein